MRKRSQVPWGRRWGLVAAAAAALAGSIGTDGVAKAGPVPAVDEVVEGGWTLPNLVPDVDSLSIQPSVYDPASETFVPGPLHLYFDTYVQNLGTAALELTADDPTNPGSSPVSQCVAWVTERVCRERRTVGGFVWHEAHDHYHFEGFASYALRRIDKRGRIDFSPRGVVSLSDKVSFCLMDTAQVEFSVPGFLLAWYTRCTPVVQGISPGWLDVYGSELPGQQLPLNNIRDGRYALVVEIDSGHQLAESEESDNIVVARIQIFNGRTGVRVLDKAYR